MLKREYLFLVMFFVGYISYSQVGIGTPSPSTTSVFELSSVNKGFLPPRLTVIQRDAITSPNTGLMLYDTTLNCMEWFNGTIWFNACGYNATSGGTALVSGYSCSTASSGSMLVGIDPAGGVTQTITATVSQVGTYSIITTTANGVTFSGSGTFAGTGAQNIVLTATGVPINSGTFVYALSTTPRCNFTRTATADPSSNGSAQVTAYNCAGTSTGILYNGMTVTGVTQTISATVGKIGTYNIAATSNGVTYSAVGTFTNIGTQNIVLTATGGPTASGTVNFVLNTTPGCTFNKFVIEQSTNGTGAVTSYNCTIQKNPIVPVSTNGNYPMVGTSITPASAIIKTVYINGGPVTGGTYNLSATANGITFSGTGTITSGTTSIDLTATGTPLATGTYTYVLNTIPTCSFDVITYRDFSSICDGSQPTTVVDIITPTGRTWMDRNLGANRLAVSPTDNEGYGCLYQWGRSNDGHASIDWTSPNTATAINGITIGVSYTDVPGTNTFLYDGGFSGLWRVLTTAESQDPNYVSTLWQGINGANNPCPSGYRIPTIGEWNSEVIYFGNVTVNVVNQWWNGYMSFLKLPLAGSRLANGNLQVGGNSTCYWSSSVPGGSPNCLPVVANTIGVGGNFTKAQGAGMPVRCIKD